MSPCSKKTDCLYKRVAAAERFLRQFRFRLSSLLVEARLKVTRSSFLITTREAKQCRARRWQRAAFLHWLRPSVRKHRFDAGLDADPSWCSWCAATKTPPSVSKQGSYCQRCIITIILVIIIYTYHKSKTTAITRNNNNNNNNTNYSKNRNMSGSLQGSQEQLARSELVLCRLVCAPRMAFL